MYFLYYLKNFADKNFFQKLKFNLILEIYLFYSVKIPMETRKIGRQRKGGAGDNKNREKKNLKKGGSNCNEKWGGTKCKGGQNLG